MDLRKSSCGRLGEVVGFGGYLLGGQRRDDQITVLAEAGQALSPDRPTPVPDR